MSARRRKTCLLVILSLDVTATVRRDLDRYKGSGAPGRVVIPKGGELSIDYELMPDTKLPVDREAVVKELLDADSRAGIASGRFRLERDGQILQVIPTMIKNSAGALVPQQSVLDESITLAKRNRNGLQTREAICAAVSKASQTQVIVGIIPLNLFLNHRDHEGANTQKARDILVKTLERTKNGSNLSWQLLYDPGMRVYVLNIHQIPIVKATLDGQ